MTQLERALFLDRDGVINVDHGYIGSVDRFELIPGVVEALARAAALGYRLVVVTNQSGIARGYFSAADYDRVEDHMVALFADKGIRFTGIYHCPHHIAGVVGALSVPCDCRKPAPGMILRACRDHAIDPARSIMLGDRRSDLKAGDAAGVGNGFLISPVTDASYPSFTSLADFIASPTFDQIEQDTRHYDATRRLA